MACVQRPVLTRVLSLQVTARVLASIQSYDRVDASKVTPTSQFGDLGLDSLDQVRLLFACS